MTDDRLPVHLGDSEIVDGVLVTDKGEVSPWTQVVVYTGATVVAVGTIVVGAAVVLARRRERERASGPLALLDVKSRH